MNTHKVIWREGMLLRPQHFQHNDRYYDHQMKTRTQLLGRFTWGFLSLVIDPQSLGTSKLTLCEASGIFPDGSLFELSGQGEPLVLDVPANTVRTAVYLALPMVTGNHIEARADLDTDVLARYAIYDANIDDSNAGEVRSGTVQCGRPDFRLLLGEQQRDSTFVKLKLCEIISCTADHGVVLNTDYVPTVIYIDTCEALSGHLKEVISLVGTRADALAERISSSGQAGGSEVGNFMMLQLMNRMQVELLHYKELRRVHPEELYRQLLSLVAELATFASGNRRPLLDLKYEHSDQSTSFSTLIAEFRLLMSMVLEEHATSLPLIQRAYGVQVAMVVDRQHFNSASFVLVAGAHCGVEALRNQVPNQIKIGTVETISDLVNLHLRGFTIRPLAVAPREIAFHTDKAYFILDLDADDLAKLKASGGFALHVSGDLPGLDLKFWAIKK